MAAFLLLICLLPNIRTSLDVKQSAENHPDTTANFDPFMTDSLLSGPITEVPWENEQAFTAAKAVNHCPILMGAYKTVLKDPLPGEEENVHLAARYISGSVLTPNNVFSQNNTAGPYTTDRGYKEGPTYFGANVSTTTGGGVCKIASTLYNVVVLSNLAIAERHNHSMPVPYVPYGQDATVYYGVKDFKFKNNTDYPVMIWAQGIDNVLYIGIYGQVTPPKVEWKHDVIQVTKAQIIYQTNSSLPTDTENMLHEGMDGATIDSTITLTYPDGKTETRNMGRDYYSPLPYIIERNK